jgi:hypothetical protein
VPHFSYEFITEERTEIEGETSILDFTFLRNRNCLGLLANWRVQNTRFFLQEIHRIRHFYFARSPNNQKEKKGKRQAADHQNYRMQ